MEWLILGLVLTFSLVFLTSVKADESFTTCLNDTTKRTRTYMTITGSGSDTVIVDENVTCSDGCSDTLNDCRWDALTQVIYSGGLMGGFLVFSILSMYISMKMESPIFMGILPIVSVLSVFVAITDVFGTGYRAIFLGFTFIPMGLMLSALTKEVED